MNIEARHSDSGLDEAKSPPSIFVSHSSSDAGVAKILVELLVQALGLRAESIRCTSVPGYKLPSGADTNEMLREESINSKCFIALLSGDSIASLYVAFELGARWGARKPMVPATICGLHPGKELGPLSSINAKDLSVREDAQDLVEDVGAILDIRPCVGSSWSVKLDALVDAASRVSQISDHAVVGRAQETISPADLSTDEQSILHMMMLVNDDGGRATVHKLLHGDFTKTRVEAILGQLRKKDLLKVEASFISSRSTHYCLTESGRRLALDIFKS